MKRSIKYKKNIIANTETDYLEKNSLLILKKILKKIVNRINLPFKIKIFKNTVLLIKKLSIYGFNLLNNTKYKLASLCYLSYRRLKLPILLNEIAEILNINNFDLTSIYLNLCKILGYPEIGYISSFCDPSFFINKIVNYLNMGKLTSKIAKTALLILCKIKNYRKGRSFTVNGLCGAAVYISLLAYGIKKKLDVLKKISYSRLKKYLSLWMINRSRKKVEEHFRKILLLIQY